MWYRVPLVADMQVTMRPLFLRPHSNIQTFIPRVKLSSRSITRVYLSRLSPELGKNGFRSYSSKSSSNSSAGSISRPILGFLGGLVIGYGIFTESQPVATHDELPVGLDLKGKIYPELDLKAATAKLRAEETSVTISSNNNTHSVTRYDAVRLASSSPVEDDLTYEKVDVGKGQPWNFWGVYDGHAGWATSAVLRQSLIAYVARELKAALDTADIESAIKTGFLRLDNKIVSDGLNALEGSLRHAEALSRIAPASAGSCALLAIHDPATSILRVACVGDSRAVLGRWAPSSPPPSDLETKTPDEWTAIPLSEDQTGFNSTEQERIFQEHPGEADVIDTKTGRVLGLAVTRAFGDNRWKWPAKALEVCEKNFFGKACRPKYFSPPYLTAEPVVKTALVQAGDFLILASDGLWDVMSSEDAVKCVGMWVEEYQKRNAGGKANLGESIADASKTSNGVIEEEKATMGFSWGWKSTVPDFIVEENNVATHLVKNGLGGKRRELFCSVMSLQAPEAKYARDDITVQVIFFGDVLGKR